MVTQTTPDTPLELARKQREEETKQLMGFGADTASKMDLTEMQEIQNMFKEIFADKRSLPTIVNVKIDYSKKTKFTEGVVKTNLGRFPLRDKVRILTRALKRHILG